MTTLGASTERYLRAQRATGQHSRKTTDLYRSVLNRFCEALGRDRDVGTLQRRHIVKFLGTFEHLSANTRHTYWKALNGWDRWMVENDEVAKSLMRGIRAPRVPVTSPVVLNAEQAAAMIAAARGPGERLIVVFGLQLGLRRAEIAGLQSGDVDLVGKTVRVVGKGGNERTLPLTVLAEVAARDVMRTRPAGPLLDWTPNAVGKRARAIAERAGVKRNGGDGIGTHTLRRTAATDIHDSTSDIVVVQEVLGHASIATTRRYIASRPSARLRAAMEGRAYGTPA